MSRDEKIEKSKDELLKWAEANRLVEMAETNGSSRDVRVTRASQLWLGTIPARPESWVGFDDVMCVWFALVTERERLRRVISTGSVQEPMFGPPITTKELSSYDVHEVRKKLARVEEMADMTLGRRERIAAAFAPDPEKSLPTHGRQAVLELISRAGNEVPDSVWPLSDSVREALGLFVEIANGRARIA